MSGTKNALVQAGWCGGCTDRDSTHKHGQKNRAEVHFGSLAETLLNDNAEKYDTITCLVFDM